MALPSSERNIVFISKATPGDDDFALWLAPKLEAAGYQVFADILCLDVGDRWRKKLTKTLQERAAKMLLCCSDETLDRDGVQEEIAIAEGVSKEIGDENFVLPLRIRPHKALFGISGMQRIDFSKNWADGLSILFEQLDKLKVPRGSVGTIQPQWEQYLRRKQIALEHMPEVLTSNWLRITSAPDELFHIEPNSPVTLATMLKLGRSFEYPMRPHGRGFLTFANPIEMGEHFSQVGTFSVKHSFGLADFIGRGADEPQIRPREAKNMVTDLLRQSWEKYCERQGFLGHEYSGAMAYHVGKDKLDLGKYTSWGTQGERRRAMLRNIAKGKVWEYGVSVIPSLFPYPHLRLKSRVLFSDMEEGRKTIVIKDTDRQHNLRRTVCSGWRNNAWYGRLMAFTELLAGDSPTIRLPVGSGRYIELNAMPIQFTSPVTTKQSNELGDDAEETDVSVLGNYFDPEDA